MGSGSELVVAVTVIAVVLIVWQLVKAGRTFVSDLFKDAPAEEEPSSGFSYRHIKFPNGETEHFPETPMRASKFIPYDPKHFISYKLVDLPDGSSRSVAECGFCHKPWPCA